MFFRKKRRKSNVYRNPGRRGDGRTEATGEGTGGSNSGGKKEWYGKMWMWSEREKKHVRVDPLDGREHGYNFEIGE